ncbi:hypothetical protein ACQKGD_19600 [Peribacillus frigoritolerans]|uniref:hypothetical protein n=1 Tax=Peribacillus frigoritolerans TaxID=450367 RepID=UPI003D05ED17
MEMIKRILYLLLLGILICIGVLICTQLFEQYSKETDFFDNLSKVSSSISAIGGLLVLIVTFFYFLETRKMTIATRRQTELLEEPAVSLKIVPDDTNINFLYVIMKNTGGGPAYDISVNFEPDIKYGAKTLNQLKMFNKMPLLDKGEEVKFFFDSAIEYFESDKPMETRATVSYFLSPQSAKNQKPIIREFTIDIEERKGLYHLSKRDINDLVKEIEELKHALIIASIERKGDEV